MTVATPCIRGAVLKQSIDWLGSLIVSKRTSPMALGVELAAEDFSLFTQRIEFHRWYPIQSATRIDEALVRAHGGGPQSVMSELGARRGRQLLDASPGLLSDLRRSHGRTSPLDVMRVADPLNFGRWECLDASEDDGFRLELFEAEAVPETLRWNLQGFLAVVASEPAGRSMRIRSERSSPARIVFVAEPAAGRHPTSS